jgi:hypothetical protein
MGVLDSGFRRNDGGFARQRGDQEFSVAAPVVSKSAVLRVTTVMPWTSAVAAISGC